MMGLMLRLQDNPRLKRLAPLYLVLAVLLFSDFFWANRHNFMAANFGQWISLAIVVLTLPLAGDWLWRLRGAALNNPRELERFRIICFLLGLVLFMPAILTAVGFDIGT